MSLEATSFGGAQVAPPRFGLSVKSLGNGALWLAAFLSGFVIEEPAPYELYLVLLSVIWLACGLKLRREFAPLIILMMLYIAGGILSVPHAQKFGDAAMYMAVSGFLAITAIFYAAIVAERPDRIQVVQNGYIAAAVLAASIAIAGYFRLFPGSDYFTLYDRARGTFQDPNVLGPFLVLPTLLLIQKLMLERVHRHLHLLAPIGILLFAIFLTFSRGAWGMLLASLPIVYGLALIMEPNSAKRARLLLLAVFGLLAATALLAIALSFDDVAAMFEQRARLVQDYDDGRYGRFARYLLGFQLVMEHPLGLGPLEFNKYFHEDEHNVYLKGFTTYGWLGGVVYVLLACWTWCAMVPLLFKARPWTPFTQCLFAVFTAHIVFSFIIDTDHWRHMYLFYGLCWGLIAADRLEKLHWQQGSAQQLSQPVDTQR